MSGCEIRIGPENPDVKCGEIRAIKFRISEFVRMRRICPENPVAKCEEIRAINSGISAFVRIRNWCIRIVSNIPEVITRICENNPDVRCGEIRAIATWISEKSGCEMRRNPDLFPVVVACCLLNKVLEHFRICNSGFIRMCDAEKSGQVPW